MANIFETARAEHAYNKYVNGVWSDVSEVPLGEEDIEAGGDALNYISSDTVTTSVRESITINGGHVIQANVIADNGIIHVIDKVLVPPFTML